MTDTSPKTEAELQAIEDEYEAEREDYSEYGDVDGYDRNGAFDGFNVHSDADNGL